MSFNHNVMKLMATGQRCLYHKNLQTEWKTCVLLGLISMIIRQFSYHCKIIICMETRLLSVNIWELIEAGYSSTFKVQAGYFSPGLPKKRCQQKNYTHFSQNNKSLVVKTLNIFLRDPQKLTPITTTFLIYSPPPTAQATTLFFYNRIPFFQFFVLALDGCICTLYL